MTVNHYDFGSASALPPPPEPSGKTAGVPAS